jgi:hypothetical protein
MKTMQVSKNLECSINLPAAIRDADDTGVHSLPPYDVREVYPTDKYPAAPADWPRGDAKSASFFVPVQEGRGMWLDFNPCRSHTHEVAVLLSIQGINPLTGAKIEGFGLDQYKTKCPVHACEFQANRHCPECGYAWPAQNYLCTTGTPNGQLWLDGFRAPDGKVRQYVFTAEEARGVAAQIIGDKRSFNIGIAFYLSNEKKKVQPASPVYRGFPFGDVKKSYSHGSVCSADDFYSSGMTEFHDTMTFSSKLGKARHMVADSKPEMHVNNAHHLMEEASVEKVTMEDRLEIAAGAQIRQDVYPDPESIDYWKAEPEGIIYVQYASAADVAKILAGGVRATKADGFMQDIKVGSK